MVCSVAGESQRVFNIGTERAPNFGTESREVSDPRVQGESSTCSDETRHARRSTMHTGPPGGRNSNLIIIFTDNAMLDFLMTAL